MEINHTERTNGLTDDDIERMIANSKSAGDERPGDKSPASGSVRFKTPRISRNILVIGTGDGGCNIASEIKKTIPEVFSIAYNTSKRAMETLKVDAYVIPNAEDGSGKDRSYSKGVFKRSAYKTILDIVKKVTSDAKFEYIIVTTTADGGTGGGSSPNIAKVIADNVDIPVLIVGVYPALSEDAKAQYNTIAWQADVEKTGLPYMIYDNQRRANFPKAVMQSAINTAIATDMTVITGAAYGDTNISAIDNRDMYMMLIEAGKRINTVCVNGKPKVGESLDEFLISQLNVSSTQPLPVGQTAMGLFVRGPKSFISSIDTSLFGFRDHFGDALLYTHIEEAESVCISMVIAGSGLPDTRLDEIKDRYNDIMSNVRESAYTAAAVLNEIDDPFAIKAAAATAPDEEDFSGLDL